MKSISKERWRRLEAVLDDALDLDDEGRARLLEKLGDEDPDLRRDAERLLRAERNAPSFLDGSASEYGDDLLRADASDELSSDPATSYQLLHEIGQGGMGTVYEAYHPRLRRNVALKFLSPHLAQDRAVRERFIDEARAAAALDHPNVCTIHDIGRWNDGRIFIAMTRYDGETLRQRLSEGPVPPAETVRIVRQIANGLRAAHDKGIIHRDIKPSNVMIGIDGIVKVLDFGLAKLAGSLHRSTSGSRFGTVAYMSPEQASGEPTDARTDVWSLGVVVYEMLTGERPFRGETDREVIDAIRRSTPKPVTTLRDGLHSSWNDFVSRALAGHPDDRFADMDAMLEALPGTPPRRAGRSVAIRRSPSIAVLPFADMSPKGDQGHFCDGIVEEIINVLARIDGLHVAARTSSFNFRDQKADIRTVGSYLDVETILEGSVRRHDDRLRVTVRLTNVEDGFRLWSESYDREVDDIFAIQDEIAENTVTSLKGVLTEQVSRALRTMPEADVRAYDFYLRGRRYFSRHTRRDHEFARQMFARAIDLDAEFAHARAGFSDACVLLYKHFDHDPTYLVEADTASAKAVELRPELGEAHAARGLFLSLRGDHDEAGREFETAIRLGPRHYESHFLYAVHEGCMRGNTEHAAVLYGKAAGIRPDDYQAHFLHGAFRRGLAQTEVARGAYETGLDLARRHIDYHPDDHRAIYLSANAFAALGDRPRALKWADRAMDVAVERSPFLLYNMAAIHALADLPDLALDYLQQAIDAGYSERAPIRNDPDFESLRGNTRFSGLIESIPKTM